MIFNSTYFAGFSVTAEKCTGERNDPGPYCGSLMMQKVEV